MLILERLVRAAVESAPDQRNASCEQNMKIVHGDEHSEMRVGRHDIFY